MTIYAGETKEISFTTLAVTDGVETAADPESILVEVRLGGAVQSAYDYPGTVSRRGSGSFYVRHTFAEPGQYDITITQTTAGVTDIERLRVIAMR